MAGEVDVGRRRPVRVLGLWQLREPQPMSSSAPDSSSLPTGWVNSAFGPLPASFASGSSLACAASARSAGIDPSRLRVPEAAAAETGQRFVGGVERARTPVPGLLLDALRPAEHGARIVVRAVRLVLDVVNVDGQFRRPVRESRPTAQILRCRIGSARCAVSVTASATCSTRPFSVDSARSPSELCDLGDHKGTRVVQERALRLVVSVGQMRDEFVRLAQPVVVRLAVLAHPVGRSSWPPWTPTVRCSATNRAPAGIHRRSARRAPDCTLRGSTWARYVDATGIYPSPLLGRKVNTLSSGAFVSPPATSPSYET